MPGDRGLGFDGYNLDAFKMPMLWRRNYHYCKLWNACFSQVTPGFLRGNKGIALTRAAELVESKETLSRLLVYL